MKKANPFKTVITFVLLISVMFANCTSATFAQEERDTVTYSLSQELVDLGYRIICEKDKENTKQCISNGTSIVGAELYLRDDKRVVAFPAVNNGKNWMPQDVEFRVGDRVVSKPNPNLDYRPATFDSFEKWQNGTTFVAYLRMATVNYYNGTDLLNSETLETGENATSYIPSDIETETEVQAFSKWVDENGADAQLTNVQLNTNAYATYNSTAKHLVTFKNGENELSSNRTLDGTSPSINIIPTKESITSEDTDYTYTTTYTFAHWSVNGNEVDVNSYIVHEDTTFTAEFNEETTSTKKPVVAPIAPTTPTTPAAPATPVVPDTTVTPETPEITVTPETTVTPEATVTPETTVTPATTQTQVVRANAQAVVEANPQAVAAVATPQVETINEEATPLNNEVAQQETIANDETPLAKPVSITSTWSLINLICMLATILLGIYAFVKTRKHVTTTFNKASAVFMFVASVVTFFLTQDVMSTMNFVDGWTIVMAIILAVQCAIVCIRKQANQEK